MLKFKWIYVLASLGILFLIVFTTFQSNHGVDTSKKTVSRQEREKIDPKNSVKFYYKSPVTQQLGKPFYLDKSWLKHLTIPPKDFVKLTNDTIKNFVFTTAASKGFEPIVLDAIATIQSHLPKHKILFYDLGISEENLTKIKRLCHVTYKKFDFSVYPKHVKQLYNYAWKPLIIMEVLREYPGVLWVDSSARLTSANLEGIYKQVKRTNGALYLSTTGHSNYAVTHPDMYLYLPSDLYSLSKMEQREANVLFFYRTAEMYENVLQWYIYCALQRECIAPSGSELTCLFQKEVRDHWQSYSNCHRYDQSLINILLGNYFKYDTKMLMSDDRIIEIKRGDSNKETVKYCEK